MNPIKRGINQMHVIASARKTSFQHQVDRYITIEIHMAIYKMSVSSEECIKSPGLRWEVWFSVSVIDTINPEKTS